MTSTPLRSPPPDWASRGLRYYTLSDYFQRLFGRRVWKISIDAGLSCPNIDGTMAREGCIFCDNRSFSPSRRRGWARRPVAEQIADAVQGLKRRYGSSAGAFVAYFQPATNTHGPIEVLLPLWQQAVSQPGVVGLAVGTRPDCVGDDVLDALQRLAADRWVLLELGLQSIHQRSLDWLRRKHNFGCFEDCVRRAKNRGLCVGVHLMLGLPNETPSEMIETANEMARLRVDSVKLHNLYVVPGTSLEALWQRGEVRLPTLDEYVGHVVDFLERIPDDCVVDRIAGDAPPGYLLAPLWCLNKSELRRAVEAEFERRGTRQGSHCPPGC